MLNCSRLDLHHYQKRATGGEAHEQVWTAEPESPFIWFGLLVDQARQRAPEGERMTVILHVTKGAVRLCLGCGLRNRRLLVASIFLNFLACHAYGNEISKYGKVNKEGSVQFFLLFL